MTAAPLDATHRAIVAARTFLAEQAGAEVITSDVDVLASGLLTSMAAMSLIVLIEEQLEIEIPDEEITRDNFGTMSSIEALIVRVGSRPGRSSAP